MDYQESTSEHSKLDISRIDDSLLAGLYSSGHSNLETINTNLFNLILEKSVGIIKVDFDEQIYLTTILTSILQLLIDSEKNNVLFLTSSVEKTNEYLTLFKKLSNYLQNIFILNLEEYKNKESLDYSHLIITDINSVQKSDELEKLNLILIEDCTNDNIINNVGFDRVSRIIISKSEDNLEVIQKTISKPENKSVTIDETLNEETEFDKDQEPINLNSVENNLEKVELVEEKVELVEEKVELVEEKVELVEEKVELEEEKVEVLKKSPEMATPIEKAKVKKEKISKNALLLLRRRR